MAIVLVWYVSLKLHARIIVKNLMITGIPRKHKRCL